MIKVIPSSVEYRCDSCGALHHSPQEYPFGRPRYWSRLEHAGSTHGALRLLLCASCSTRASHALSAFIRSCAA